MKKYPSDMEIEMQKLQKQLKERNQQLNFVMSFLEENYWRDGIDDDSDNVLDAVLDRARSEENLPCSGAHKLKFIRKLPKWWETQKRHNRKLREMEEKETAAKLAAIEKRLSKKEIALLKERYRTHL